VGRYTLEREEAKIEARVKKKKQQEKEKENNIKKVDTSTVNNIEALILPNEDDSFSNRESEISFGGDQLESPVPLNISPLNISPLNISVSSYESSTGNKSSNFGTSIQSERRTSPRSFRRADPPKSSSNHRSYIRKPEARVRRSEMMKKNFNTYNTPKIQRNLSKKKKKIHTSLITIIIAKMK
jgi:hypothetical protein